MLPTDSRHTPGLVRCVLPAALLLLTVACSPMSERAKEASTGDKGQPVASSVERSEAVGSTGAEVTSSPIDRLLASSAGSAWYGLYMLDKKVGHARLWIRATEQGEPGRVVVGTDAQLSVQGQGQATTVSINEKRYYEGKAPYALLMTEMSQTAQGLTTVRRATRDGDGLMLTTEGQQDPPRRIAGTAETVHSVLAMSPLDLTELVPGKTAEVPVFDWESLKDQVVAVTLKGRSTLQRSGVITPVVELEMHYRATGLKGVSLIAENGVALRTTLGPGLVLKLEEQAVAKGQVTGLDVASSGVRVTRRLVSPQEYESLTLGVTLAEGVMLPVGPGQRVARKGPTSIELQLSTSAGEPVSEEERAEALQPHGAVNSKHPAIEAQALALTAGLRGDRHRAEALLKWVHKTLKKQLATHIPSASQVLERRVGDCTEHTWLFVALARASGLAARPVYGLMYIDSDEPGFGYHAWADVAIDGRWLAVDPTWGQMPADATHIRLGEDGMAVASVMGGLGISLPEPPKDTETTPPK